jgi:hypothetical protein
MVPSKIFWIRYSTWTCITVPGAPPSLKGCFLRRRPLP